MKTRSIFTIVSVVVLFGLAGAAYAAPTVVTSASFSPNSGYAGTTTQLTINFTATGSAYNAVCIYALDAGWNTNFPGPVTSVLGDTYAKNAGTACPAVGGYTPTKYDTATANAFADGGDTLVLDVTVPPISAGIKAIVVRQFSDAAMTVVVNTLNTNFTVLGSPTTVYAGSSAAVCTGYNPCYTSLAAAYSAVSTGGTVRVLNALPAESLSIAKDVTLLDYTGSGTLTGAATSAVLNITAGTVVIQDLSINAGSATNVIGMSGGAATVKGNTLVGGSNAFNQSGGTLTAYANNISGFTTGVNTTGTFHGRNNWWGSATPANVGNADANTYRLGAAIAAWGEGSLGAASISGGTGLGVVVSHGRGQTNAPFGKASTADGYTQCSDYYDYFVTEGSSGNWDVTLPIDVGTGCDATYNSRLFFMFALSGGVPDPTCTPDTACWSLVSPVTQLGRNVGLRFNMNSASLGGTPFVAGNQSGNDPTAVTLTEMTAQSSTLPWTLVLASVLVVAGMLVGALRWRAHRVKA